MKASVVGLGKLGAPLLAVLASRGLEVCGIDLNPEAVTQVASGIAPVQEAQLQELITAHKARIRATSDWQSAIGDSDITYVLVPTPSGADGAFRNDHLLAAIDKIGAVLKRKPGYHLVVVNSTTMPGSLDGPVRERLEAVSGKRVGPDLGLCYNPEFVALGSVIHDLLHPDFVLIGESDARAGEMLEEVCRQIVGDTVPISRMSFVNAELTKISVNAYVTTKISFANMLGEICDGLAGADADVVTAALGQDTRIGGRYLRGATGFGGPCFPRDTVAFATMARQIGVAASLVNATQAINERQLARVQDIVTARTDAADRIAVLGLAYKPGTGVVEHSQGLMLAAALVNAGRRVIVHDPLALDAARAALGPGVQFAASAAEAVGAAEAVVVMVPCPEYRTFFAGWSGGAPTRLVVDCWRLVNSALAANGLHVVQLGRYETFTAPAGAAAATAAD
jgi:UDPglucose 6-dehydrogenase